MPAPRRNDNATGHQLYSQSPFHQVIVSINAPISELASKARDLGDAALWIADRLALEMNVTHSADVYEASALYAAVAHELHQVAAELEGETGIKAAPLGKLSPEAYDRLIEQQTRALNLILSQCTSAWVSLYARVEVYGEKEAVNTLEEIKRILAPVGEAGRVLPVLKYMAGHMRKAMRAMRDLAANRAWQIGLNTEDDDPAARIMAAIQAKKAGKDDEG